MASGREQRRAHAAAHTPDLSRFYRYRLPPITPGEFEFHLDLLRPHLKPFPLDSMVDTFNWVDEQAVMTGSLTAHRPDPEDPRTLPIGRGHLVRCRVRWDEGLYDLWTMRVDPPQVQVDQGTVQVTLKDDMALLDSGKQDWLFRKTKRQPFGVTCDEAAREVARRLGLKTGQIAKGTHRFTLVKRKTTALAVLRSAYALEKQHSGRSFVIRMRNGRLEVVELNRNSLVYVLADQIQTALITQKAGQDTPTTILTGRARLGHGAGARKISYTEYDRRVIGLLGAVRDTKDYGRVDSHQDLRDKVKRDLAKGLRINDLATVTHQGIPFIQRGDGAKLKIPSEGYDGEESFVYATRANHTVQGGVYTSDWDFTLADPYLGKKLPAVFAAQQRSAKRAARKRSALKK